MSPAGMRAGLVLLALGVAALCWMLPGLVGERLGTDGYWPLDRLLVVFAGLTALERFLKRGDAAH